MIEKLTDKKVVVVNGYAVAKKPNNDEIIAKINEIAEHINKSEEENK